MDLKNLQLDKIETERIVRSIWIAKTTIFIPNKTEIEMKGDGEQNAYEKLLKFLEYDKKPDEVETLPNGNKIYHFKNPIT